MKRKNFLLILCIGLSTIIYSQSKKDNEILNDLIWGASNNTVEIPEKWKNESAVFLLKSIDYTYNRPHNSIEYTRIIHEKIKLLDQAAVTDYSEFKYKKNNSYRSYGTSIVKSKFTLGVKIIKPDGTEIIVDSEKVIEEDDQNKLAIPNLEKGDIIDYYFHTNVIMGENDLYHYEPVEDIVNEIYPIMDYQFVLNTEKDFFILFNTFNGAPKLKEEDLNLKKNRDRVRKYSFNMKDVDKKESQRWFYPFVELPSYKFQVNFARTGKYEKRAYAFIPKEADSIKSIIKKEDIFEFYTDKFRPYGDLGFVSQFLKGKTFASDEEKVKAVYYFIRHKFFTNYIEAYVFSEAKIMNAFIYYGYNPILFNKEEEFVRYFAAFLKNEKIDYEILIGSNRYNGDISKLLLESNVEFVLKVKTENPIYIESFNHYSTVNVISSQLEGINAYALKVTDQKHIDDIETTQLPKSSYKENNTSDVIDLTISDDFSTINVLKKSKNLGQNKLDEQGERLMFYDYVYQDYEKYGSLSVLDYVKKKKDKDRYEKELDALIVNLKEKQKESFKKLSANEFSLELEDYDFKIVNNGRFGKGDAFEMDESFKINKDLIKKAGPNYILQIGKMIGGQIALEEKEKIRENSIFMSYPRSFSDAITLKIPEGYSVEGIESLNFDVVNETGGFTSKTTLEGNLLKITTMKFYANNFEPKENWSKMISFLDVAYQFSQGKILLKKN
jgi:hypothetical protein